MENEIVRAWKDPLYRETLGQAPANPAGIVELTDEELKRSSGMFSGGIPLTTAMTCTEYTFHGWTSCGCPSPTA
jgi:mersacidin/lichenicidin family type 2 lantibiotic